MTIIPSTTFPVIGRSSNFAADGHADPTMGTGFAPSWKNDFWHNHNAALPGATTAEIQADLNWLKSHTTELR